MPCNGFNCSLSDLYNSDAIIEDCKPHPKTDTDERWEWLREISQTALRGIMLCIFFAATTLAFWVLYWPIARGYCWLILVIAYWMGTSPWPGPYTPYP